MDKQQTNRITDKDPKFTDYITMGTVFSSICFHLWQLGFIPVESYDFAVVVFTKFVSWPEQTAKMIEHATVRKNQDVF